MPLLTTQAELEKRFSSQRISDLAQDPNVAPAQVIEAQIKRADGEIRNLLSVLYTDAQMEADAGLQGICENLTLYLLEMRRGSTTEHVQGLYQWSLQQLALLREGRSKLKDVAQLLPRRIKEPVAPFTRSELFEGLVPDEEGS